jgi:hypothetical protein
MGDKVEYPVATDQEPGYDARSAVPVERRGDHSGHNRPHYRRERPVRPRDRRCRGYALDTGHHQSEAQEVEYLGSHQQESQWCPRGGALCRRRDGKASRRTYLPSFFLRLVTCLPSPIGFGAAAQRLAQ